MKTTLLFFILAFSASIFAQNNPALPSVRDAKSKLFSKTALGLPGMDSKENTLHPDRSFAKEMERQTRELFTDIQVYDSIYLWQWDSFTTKWDLMTKAVNILYNGAGLYTSITYQNLVSGTWVNLGQFNITYDGNNNELSSTFKSWNGTFFKNEFQDVYTYDANNNQTSDIYQEWNGTAWVNSLAYIDMYDGNNNLISELNQEWNGTGWDNYNLVTYTYDANKNLLSGTHQNWNDIDLVWENSGQELYTYDANNNLITYTSQYWNVDIVGWEDTGLTTYTYNANNHPVNQLFQFWDGTKWVNYYNLIYTYNASEDLTNTLLQTWNVSNWDNSSRTTNTYNGNHQVIKSLTEGWDGGWIKNSLSYNTYGENDFLESYSNRNFNIDGVIVTDGDSTHNFFHTITGTHDVHTDDLNIIVYPNPNNGKFTIGSKDAIQSVAVYNLMGERMFSVDQAKGQTTTEINLAEYGKGIYLISMRDGNNIVNRKVVVQ